MDLHFYSPNRIEPWDYRNVFDVGIGGSETSHVEMAIRLAAHGHVVTSYTHLPADTGPHTAHGVRWEPLEAAGALTTPGLWIIYRQPSVGARFTPAPDRRAWLVCQDVWYPDWKSEDVAKFDRVLALCPRHVAEVAHVDPANAARIALTGNGVNIERSDRVLAEGCTRHPRRLIWTSSPDRGLRELLDIFARAREQVADLELFVFYGMDNIDKICGGDRLRQPWVQSWRQYDRANAMPGVTWVGRVGQEALAREFASAGIWCYPTWFSETSCISCMEAQVYGAIPITNPIWATGFNVQHGWFVEGTPSDPLVMARYVDAVVRLAVNPDGQQMVRARMMPEARERLDWQGVAQQWDAWMRADTDVPIAVEELTHVGA